MNATKLMIALSLTATAALSNPAAGQLKDLLKWTRGTTGEPVEASTIAYFKLGRELVETPVEMPPLFGGKPPMSLKDLLRRLGEARRDSDVVAVIIDIQRAAIGGGQLEELHRELRKFVVVDKKIYVHSDTLNTRTYALATGAAHISVVPTGDIWLTGLYGESPYMRDALDSLGIVPDLEHCGGFKTAHEPFTQTGPSKESEAMTKWLMDGLYESLVKLMADGRDMSPEAIRKLIDNGPYSAEDALKAGLIDSVQHRQDFVSSLKDRYGEEVKIDADYGADNSAEIPEDLFSMFAFIMEMMNPSPKTFSSPTVAVVYVDGMIQTGSAEISPFGSSQGAYSTTIRKALDKAADEEAVKAVVMRIDSPGGSALASEIIWDAARRVAEKKPLIVSMGNVAASGGYYVACCADTIFADAATITASIGVVGGKMVTTGAWKKLGVNWVPSKRGAMAGLMSTATSFSTAERAKIQHLMNTIYEVFKGHVVDGRKGKLTKPIDEMAGGRVYTGLQAKELGLVDRIGGLQDAIKLAADKANVSDFDLRVIPEPPGLLEMFQSGSTDSEFSHACGSSGGSLGGKLSLLQMPVVKAMLASLGRVDPQRMRAMFAMFQRIELIQSEGVIAVMPLEWVIR